MSGLRQLARTFRARGITSSRGFTKKAKAKGQAAKATASGDFGGASSVGADTRSEDAPPGSEDAGASEAQSGPGTAGEAADEAARVARAAAANLGSWAKGFGAKAAEAGSRASADAGARVPKSASGLFGTVVGAFKEEYRLAMMDPGDAAAERRKQRPGYVDPGPVDEYTGTTAVATRKEEKSAFRRAFESVAERAGITSVFAKLQGLKQTGAYKKGEEALEDMRERWETSDSPLVHRIQDMQEGLWTETEQAEAYRIIRQRQPDFEINGFLAEVRRDVPKVLGAYLKGDVEALEKTNTSKEMLERMGGQMRLWQTEQQFVDPRILHLSELELVEVRMMENDPLVVLQFSCQQINCVRNKAGEIVDGAEDDIQAVHYLWAMQLAPKDFISDDGRPYSAQTWQLREMVLRGMMAIV